MAITCFTTLIPNLGIVRYRDHRSFVMADIPGIIERGPMKTGLGTDFCDIRTNSILLFLIPMNEIREKKNICSIQRSRVI
ncbi:MAG: GTPase [Bacteroidia bacterium]